MNLEKYVRLGERLGLSEVEIAVKSQGEVSVEVEMGRLKGASSGRLEHLVVRGLIGKRLGVYHSDRATEEELEKAVKMVVKIARSNQPDEKWTSLPEPQSYGPPIRWERGLLEEPAESYVKYMGEAFKLVSERDPRALIAFGGSGKSYQFIRVVNSHGVDYQEDDGGSYIFLGLIGMGGEAPTPMIMGFSFSRTVDPNVEKAVKEAVSKLSHAYRVRRGRTEVASVIIDPRPLEELLRFTLVQAILGENVVRSKSPLAGKLGEKVASEVLTVVEEPHLPEAMASRRGDDEGVATRRKPIVERGVLRTFLWDSYWAGVRGVEPTGNGFRNWDAGSVSTRPTNLVVKPGKRSLEDIIGEVKRGYYIVGVQGAHSSNPDTGDFSVAANPAYLIEDGEIKGFAPGVMLGGNIYRLLANIDEVAREPLYGWNLVSPAILFRDVPIASKG